MNILDTVIEKCQGGIDCIIRLGFNPRIDVVTGVNVSFWASRMFGYALLGLASVTWLPKLAMLALGVIDSWLTFNTNRNLMKLRRYSAAEAMFNEMLETIPLNFEKDGESFV